MQLVIDGKGTDRHGAERWLERQVAETGLTFEDGEPITGKQISRWRYQIRQKDGLEAARAHYETLMVQGGAFRASLAGQPAAVRRFETRRRAQSIVKNLANLGPNAIR